MPPDEGNIAWSMTRAILIDVAGFNPFMPYKHKSQFEIIWTVMQKETRGEKAMSINRVK